MSAPHLLSSTLILLVCLCVGNRASAQQTTAQQPSAQPPAASWDLLLKGGHVIDARNSIDRVMDVSILDGKIALGDRPAPSAARPRVVNATGLYVTPASSTSMPTSMPVRVCALTPVTSASIPIPSFFHPVSPPSSMPVVPVGAIPPIFGSA
ncbi:MAG: hypothetical protein U5J83_19450 [Bryobacterales bacterium]|nr:hypothetical protein [Bryobacterales bacterium]